MKKPMSHKAALARLEELCARSEQCSNDLIGKLYRWGVEPPFDDITESLAERRYLDDLRFAKAFVRDKYRFDRWGRVKIARALAAKRISRADIDEAMQEVDVREYALNCYRLLKSRRKSLGNAGLEENEMRQRLLRFIAQRGYEVSLAVRLLDNEKLWTQEDE